MTENPKIDPNVVNSNKDGDQHTSNKKGGKHPGRRNKGHKDNDRKDDKQHLKGSNSINWIVNSTTTKMRDAVARLPFGIPTGMSQALWVEDGEAINENFIVPGIATLYLWIVAGDGRSGDSALNIAAQMQYSHIRRQNSRSGGYVRSDLTIYNLAIGQCLAYLGWCVRLARLLNAYDVTNRYTPASLVKAQRVDFNDLSANQANFMAWITQFASKLRGLPIPNNIPYFANCLYAFSRIYMDGDISKAQYYQFAPAGFGVYESATSKTGSQVAYYAFTSSIGNLASARSIMAFGDRLVNALLGDSLVGLIGAEILRAYEGNLLDIPTLTLMELQSPIVAEKEPELLLQIHNATFFHVPVMDGTTPSIRYYQTIPTSADIAPYVSFEISDTVNIAAVCQSRTNSILDCFSANPSADEVQLATRLHPNVSVLYGDESEAVVQLNGFEMYIPDQISFMRYPSDTISTLNVTSCYAPDEVYTYVAYAPVFDWAPLYYFCSYNTQIAGNQTLVLGDVQNPLVVDQTTVSNIHTVSIYSLFNVPYNG